MHGYGRGYYGPEQLAPKPPQRRGGGWVKYAVVVGVGAAVWFLWPRRPKLDYTSGFGGGGEPKPVPPPAPPSPQFAPAPDLQAPLDQGARGYPTQQAYEGALARGYPTQQAYEDAVVESARQLQDAGAKVALGGHLQHLAPRLLP